jgi:dTDP-4-amino-4,6-dideoxygalactose transaminase
MEKRKVPLLDLRALHQPVRDEVLRAIARVVDSNAFILGEDVRKLEESVAQYCHTAHAVGCGSGSDALLLAMMALDIAPGDAVLTTPFSFFATAGSIVLAGATPVFVDIDPATYNMDPLALAETIRRTPRARAIIPVHLFGACADMDPILEIARSRGCAVIEDGAQAIGAEYKGRRAQSMGDIGCLSFYPTKNLGAFGEGGMVLTGDDGLAQKLTALRVHGALQKYLHRWVGLNSRLDTLQAAVLRVKFEHLDGETAGRQKNAGRYQAGLAGMPVGLPEVAPYQTRHIYNQFVIRAAERDRLKAHLYDNGVGSDIYYPLPLHQQECFRGLGYRAGDFPESERAAREVLALPVHSALAEDDVDYVCAQIRAFYA